MFLKVFTFTILILVLTKSPSHSSKVKISSFSTPHGLIYGFDKLDPETYIYKNNYRTLASGPSSYLANAIFYGHEIRYGNTMHRSDTYKHWNNELDAEWRSTTKAPYFENKIPNSEDILSAALVDVAATAFGLRSLLPLNVPPKMPLIYCKQTEYEMKQSAIELNGNLYYCDDGGGEASQTISCISELSQNLFISDGALRSHLHVFCNATRQPAMNLLRCYYGRMNSRATSFIPFKISTTDADAMEMTKSEETNEISLSAKIHKFLLTLMGKQQEHEDEMAESNEWIPDALIMPTRRSKHGGNNV